MFGMVAVMLLQSNVWNGRSNAVTEWLKASGTTLPKFDPDDVVIQLRQVKIKFCMPVSVMCACNDGLLGCLAKWVGWDIKGILGVSESLWGPYPKTRRTIRPKPARCAKPWRWWAKWHMYDGYVVRVNQVIDSDLYLSELKWASGMYLYGEGRFSNTETTMRASPFQTPSPTSVSSLHFTGFTVVPIRHVVINVWGLESECYGQV